MVKSRKKRAIQSQGTQNISSQRGVPVGVKIISVLYYIAAFISLLIGVLLFFIASYADEIVADIVDPLALDLMSSTATVGVIGGVVALACAFLFFFIGIGLWKRQQWARITTIIFSFLEILLGLNAIIQGELAGIFDLVIGAVIGSYLWFSDEVKSAFA